MDTLMDVIIDTLKLLPFLYITYLLMEYIEDKAEDRMVETLWKYEKAGPAAGALLGLIPQCGFSAAAASLFSGGIISGGTMLAVFLSTSDEMLPIMLSEAVSPAKIGHILLTKVILAMAGGAAVDLVHGLIKRSPHYKHIHELCEQENCHCEEGNIWKSALIHTAHVTLFIFLFSLVFAFLVDGIGEERIALFLGQVPFLSILLCALIGLIPNCAASVMITELFLKGMIGAGQVTAGLMVGAGVGLLVLFRTNKDLKQNIRLTLVLYLIGVLSGLIVQALGIRF